MGMEMDGENTRETNISYFFLFMSRRSSQRPVVKFAESVNETNRLRESHRDHSPLVSGQVEPKGISELISE